MWDVIIPIACTILGAVIGFMTFERAKSKEDKGEGQQAGIMLTELGYIKGSLEGVNKKLDRQEERNLEIIARLSAVESSAKQAHRRLDRMEGKVENIHEE